MIHIRIIAADQSVQDIQGKPGQSVMEAAVAANVSGIAADCGGTLTCATCHVIVGTAWIDQFPEPGQEEKGMLEFTASPRAPGSRLSCQLVLSPALDGLELHLPASQY